MRLSRLVSGVVAVIAVLAVASAILAPGASAAGVAFAPVAGSPYAGAPVASGDTGINAVQFNASGTLAAVANWSAQTVTIDTVAPGGSLTATGNSVPISEPVLAEFSPNGAYLAVFSYNDGVYMYSVGSGGTLTAVAGSPFASVDGYGMAWSPGGNLLATVGTSPTDSSTHEIAVYSVAADGALTPASQTTDSGVPIAVAFSPSGALLAVANQTGKSVGLYSVTAAGGLTLVTDYATGSSSDPYWVAFNPQTGSSAIAQLALADYGNDAVDLFAATASGLTLQSTTSTGPDSGPRAVSFSPDALLATANAANGSVSVFQLGAGGALTPLPGSPMVSGLTPTTVAFTAGGGVLAASNEYGNTLAVFAVAPPTIAVTSPTSGAAYNINQQVPIGFTCAEAAYGPGLSYCGGPGVSSDAPTQYLPTSAVGSHSVTESVLSEDGQTASVTVTYQVLAAAVSVRGNALAARRRRTRVSLHCAGGAPGAVCSGRVELSTVVTVLVHSKHKRKGHHDQSRLARHDERLARRGERLADRSKGHRHHQPKPRKRRRTVTLGWASYQIGSGHTGAVTVKLSREAGKLLTAAGDRPLTVTATVTTPGQNPAQRRLKLHAAKPRPRHHKKPSRHHRR